MTYPRGARAERVGAARRAARGLGVGAARRAARGLGVGAVMLFAATTLAVGVSSGAHAHIATAEPPAPSPDPVRDNNLSVDVTDGSQPSPSPTRTNRPPFTPPGPPPTPPGRPRSTGPSTHTAPVTAVVTQATIPNPDAADDALGDDPAVAGGVLAMSGLSASASASVGIDNGTLTLSFVVRNTSATTFDSTAEFWVDNAFGGRIASLDDVQVDDLEPDETRRVQVRIEGRGQHTVLHAHTTLTPPTQVEGAALEPLSRDTTVMVPPWFSISLASAVFAFSGLGWWLYSARGLGLRFFRIGA